jgi:hypothetical protein
MIDYEKKPGRISVLLYWNLFGHIETDGEVKYVPKGSSGNGRVFKSVAQCKRWIETGEA